MKLGRFYFAHPDVFLVGVEHLTESGLSSDFAEALRNERGVSGEWIALFNKSYATYWTRANRLYAEAPEGWFPPRRQNLLIATTADGTRPYYQPFAGASWMLYASDFDPSVSNVEFGAYQFLHAERLSNAKDMARAVIGGMSYWLTRTRPDIDRFCRACQNTPRPDARVFRRLAHAMPWVRKLYHARLRPPPRNHELKVRPIRDAGLIVPEDRLEPLEQLVGALRTDAVDTFERYMEASQQGTPQEPLVAMARTPAAFVCDWLAEASPRLLVGDGQGKILWDPDRPREVDALRQALGKIGAVAAESLQLDLEIVGRRTAKILGALREPERLPAHSEDVEQHGGVYLHEKRKLIVYDLSQPGLDVRREPAPPYHRQLLGARVIHEWGHLAAEAGMAAVPEDRKAEHEAAKKDVVDAVERLVAAAPSAFRTSAAEEAKGRAAGVFVLELIESRMSDYLANLVLERFADEAELESYIRANVASRFGEDLDPLAMLARYAYEVQYLHLGQVEDRFGYFLGSTWFRDYLVDTKVVSEAHLRAVFDATERLCRCHALDPTAFVPRSQTRPPPPSRVPTPPA